MTSLNFLAPNAAPNETFQLSGSGNSYTSDGFGVIKNAAPGDTKDLLTLGCMPIGFASQVGTVTLTGATAVTVTASSIAATDVVLFGINSVTGTQGADPVVTIINPNTSFLVKGSAADSSTYNYRILPSGA
jgi:hypothetical protein